MIEPMKLYKTKDNNYFVLVTDVKDNTVLEDLQVEYYILNTVCYSSKKYFKNIFKECIE